MQSQLRRQSNCYPQEVAQLQKGLVKEPYATAATVQQPIGKPTEVEVQEETTMNGNRPAFSISE